MSPKLLLLLGQSPFDPTSGAAQSTRLIAEVLAKTGFSVRALATSACEGEPPEGNGLPPSALVSLTGGQYEFERNGVRHQILAVPQERKHAWESLVGSRYDQTFREILERWKPDITLTFGGDATDARRRALARQSGSRVVFALHNLAYRKRPPSEVDLFLCPTEYLKSEYANALSAPIAVLPPPLPFDESPQTASDQSVVVFVNPEPAKGALLVAKLAERLGRLRPSQPLLVVGGRAPAETIIAIGADFSCDLTRYPNIFALPPTHDVNAIWRETRVLLMPSAVREAAGRCAIEAMRFGAVCLAANHGGLPEMVGDAGILLPPPPVANGKAVPPSEALVDQWWTVLCQLLDNPATWQARSQQSLAHAERFAFHQIATPYQNVFTDLLAP